MKLLPKSQVLANVNEQKRLQIEEGVILAKKVDALRQTLLDLEDQQRKFIEGQRAVLERELGQLNREIELKKELLNNL